MVSLSSGNGWCGISEFGSAAARPRFFPGKPLMRETRAQKTRDHSRGSEGGHLNTAQTSSSLPPSNRWRDCLPPNYRFGGLDEHE
jgi:hypothetical protein